MMVVVLSADQILALGLRLIGHDDDRQSRCKRETQLGFFRSGFGSDPVVYAAIFEDLQTTTIAAALVEPKKLDIHAFLWGLHFLTVYPTDNDKSSQFKGAVKTCQEWCWYYTEKIQALEKEKAWVPRFRSAVPFLL